MHLQLVTYRIPATSDRDFIDANVEFAEMMAAVPGLVAKIWLNEPDSDTYGGVYLWRDRAAYERFLDSELWTSVMSDATLSDLETRDFAVMEELTRLTQPGLDLVKS